MGENSFLNPGRWQVPLVALLGMGTGRDDLTVRTLSWMERAEVLVGGKRHLDFFPEHAGERVELKGPLGELMERIDEISRQRRTAVLASGDPMFFGIGRRLGERLGADRLIVLPNVTSVQTLFARIAEPWDDVEVVSLHGRGGEREHAWLSRLESGARLALYTDPGHTPDWIAGKIVDAGLTGFEIVVAEDLGLSSERIRRISPSEAMGMSFSALNLVAILPESRRRSPDPSDHLPLLGLPDEAFCHQAGLITKMEVRAVALALLRLSGGQVLWDLGAGSGSVSIEASRLAPLREAIAIEKEESRYRDLVANAGRFGLKRFRCIHARASAVLDDLPDPDRVFIGGSGSDLPEILDRVSLRLRPGGRVVQTAVTLETLDAVRAFWSRKPFETSISQVQVNRSIPIGKAVRFEALNPVFIITAWPKDSRESASQSTATVGNVEA